MMRAPVKSVFLQKPLVRLQSTSSFIRNSFIDFFVEKHDHRRIKSSSVVSLYDPSVPFVNAGMNQFKGVFLGKFAAPCARAVNSQKCVRVGGKHNDLDVVGTDGHHHTFFEMLGNWSFGDYYKKEACKMAWDLLLGPYRLKPENLVVTYFGGDAAMNLKPDIECRDIWKTLGVPDSRLKPMSSKENFWEMGVSGPCGPCTEIHHINMDGSLTEIWNLVFIQCHRDVDGRVESLDKFHVDTGMGLERMAAILQGVPSNYDTDLFKPLIWAIEKNCKRVPEYSGSYRTDAELDCAYRQLADHARMISVCLADGVYPASSLNLKQIMRKGFKISTDVFQNPQLLKNLYSVVAETLGPTYPELIMKETEAKLIIEHEGHVYAKLRSAMRKKWRELVYKYPEVQIMNEVDLPGFVPGYKEFKEVMAKQMTNVIPGDLVFKLYDTYGFHEDLIQRIADFNDMVIDKTGFWKLLTKHKSRHKTAYQEQANANRALVFQETIKTLLGNGYSSTDDSYKYDYIVKGNKVEFRPLQTRIIGILNEDLTWIDYLEACENRPYYIITKNTNFYCEEGGQIADEGMIYVSKNVAMQVESVFKIRDFVFHKGFFAVGQGSAYVNVNGTVTLEIDEEKRLKIMRNHTGVHLLNAAVRKVLPRSVVCAVGSKVTDKGLSLNLMVYGEKMTQDVLMEVQNLIRESIKYNAAIETRVVDSVQLALEPAVITVPGETYPELGLRLVTAHPPLPSKELCCGTHVPTTGVLEEFCVTLVKGAGSNSPTIHALTGDDAKQARELFSRAEKLDQVIELIDPERKKEEISKIKQELKELCGKGGAPYGEYARCLALLDGFAKKEVRKDDVDLQAIAETEVRNVIQQAVSERRRFVVHFLRCSYLMQSAGVRKALGERHHALATLVLGCAGGVVVAACTVPQDMVTDSFSARRWLSCIAPVFQADVLPNANASPLTFAEMTETKVSLINCEQLVQDAMRVAIKFAKSHTKDTRTEDARSTMNVQQN